MKNITARFLRFGEWHKEEKSVNFIRTRLDICEDFTYFLEYGDIDKALSLKGLKFEDGISVFKMHENGLPVIDNINLASSLALRVGKPVWELEGDIVGIGIDGEPLIKNIRIIKKRRIKKDTLVKHIIKNLVSSSYHIDYTNFDKKKMLDYDKLNIFQFYHTKKIDILTGEEVEYLYEKSFFNEDWVRYEYKIAVFCGIEFKLNKDYDIERQF